MCATVLALLLTGCTWFGPSRLVVEPEAVTQIDEMLSDMARSGTFTGSVLIAQDGADISRDLIKYSHKATLERLLSVIPNMWQVDYSPFTIQTLLTGVESFSCMEGNPSALASPAQYVEAHPARLPPLVTWTVLMLLKRLWLVLLLIGLGPMALVAWRRGRPTKSSQQPHEEDQ
jgi:hypothetical protein